MIARWCLTYCKVARCSSSSLVNVLCLTKYQYSKLQKDEFIWSIYWAVKKSYVVYYRSCPWSTDIFVHHLELNFCFGVMVDQLASFSLRLNIIFFSCVHKVKECPWIWKIIVIKWIVKEHSKVIGHIYSSWCLQCLIVA